MLFCFPIAPFKLEVLVAGLGFSLAALILQMLPVVSIVLL